MWIYRATLPMRDGEKTEKNRGFTLVELVIALAISAIGCLMVTAFLGQGGRYFQNMQKELALQKEGRLVMHQLNQLILNSEQLELAEELEETSLFLRAEDELGLVVETEVSFREGQLLLSKKRGNRVFYENRLLADRVKEFSVTLPGQEEQLLQLEILFEWEGKQYRTTQSIALRNRRDAD